MADLEKVIKALECCINAGDCKNQCDYWPDNRCEHFMMMDALELLKAQKDMVRVVRCSDCRFWYANNAEEGDASGMCLNTNGYQVTTDMNWFCADGEREG